MTGSKWTANGENLPLLLLPWCLGTISGKADSNWTPEFLFWEISIVLSIKTRQGILCPLTDWSNNLPGTSVFANTSQGAHVLLASWKPEVSRQPRSYRPVAQSHRGETLRWATLCVNGIWWEIWIRNICCFFSPKIKETLIMQGENWQVQLHCEIPALGHSVTRPQVCLANKAQSSRI